MTKGTDLIVAERERQPIEEGYTPEHDQGHAAELTWAARCYAENVAQDLSGGPTFIPGADWCSDEMPDFQDFPWPWHKDYWKPTGDPVRDLVKAGGLIAAAIDSLLADDPDLGGTATGTAVERIRDVCTKALEVKVAGSSEGDAAMAAMAAVILRILDGTEPSDSKRGETLDRRAVGR